MGVVIMPRSDVMFDPWKDQEMERGWSPLFTMHETWANDPSSMTSRPNDKGSRFGGSECKIELLVIYQSGKSFHLQCLPFRPI